MDGRLRSLSDGMAQHIGPGDVITIMSGCKHRVKALTELTMVEVQLGRDISEKDKKKFAE